MKSYSEELDEAKLLMRCIVRGYDFLLSKNDPSLKSTLEFLQYDMETIRKFGNSRGKRSNAGVECDVDDGHCACGAAHKPEEILPEQLIDPEAEVVRLRKLLYAYK